MPAWASAFVVLVDTQAQVPEITAKKALELLNEVNQ